jgi:hypothetical protein
MTKRSDPVILNSKRKAPERRKQPESSRSKSRKRNRRKIPGLFGETPQLRKSRKQNHPTPFDARKPE